MSLLPQGPTTPPERAFCRQLLTTLFVSVEADTATLKKVVQARLDLARDIGAFDPAVSPSV